MAAFSTTDAAIITHQVELDQNAQAATAAASGQSIDHLYDVPLTATKIVAGRFRHVALQFPDEALVDSVPIFWSLKRHIRSLLQQQQQQLQHESDGQSLPELYILADTSYGSCCVDEVAAQHVNADLVVHYGHACLSPTARLPVIYVFTKQPIDVDHAALTLSDSAHTTLLTDQQQLPAALVLTYSVAWEHAARSVYNKLKEILGEKRVTIPLLLTEVDTRRNYEGKLANRNPSPVQQSPVRGQAATCCSSSSSPCQPTSTCDTSSSCCKTSSSSQQLAQAPPADSQPSVEQQRQDAPLGPGRSLQLPEGVKLTDCAFLHIGPESLSLTNLILTLGPTTPIISYDPFTQRSRVETGATNRLLMKRYTHVLKARDASVIGLLVGTLGVHSYLPLLKHLRALLTSRKSARKVYTISVGKLNPAKLANFQEIDLFVLIACPENSLVDSKEFFRPIVTPFEMELALRAQERAERGEEGVDWTGEYQLDLDRLVPADVRDKFAHEESQSQADGADGGQEDEGDDDDQPHFSLITGKYVHRRKYTRNPTETTGSKAVEGGKEQQLVATGTPGVESHTVALRQADGTMTTVLQSASTAHLEQRGWRGLEQRIGLDEPSVLEEGREGIAKGYRSAEGTHEGTQP